MMTIGEVIELLKKIFNFLTEIFNEFFAGNAEGEGEGEAEAPTV